MPAAFGKGEKPMHVSFQSCARSSLKAIFGLLLICVPLLIAQNTMAPVEANKDLPDAPMPVTTALPTENNWNFKRGTVLSNFNANRALPASRMGMPPAIGHPAFGTGALASKVSRADAKDMKVAGRSSANWFALDPVGAHANHTVTHSGTQWYTSHIPWAGSIMRRSAAISKTHPRLTTVIKTLKPRL